MKVPGESTWMIRSGDSATFALYVRDALGISTPTADSIPPLTPPVPRATGIEVPPDFAQQWDHWWLESLVTRHVPDGTQRIPAHPPVGLPEQLRAAHLDWLDPTSPEASSRRQATTEAFGELLRELIGELEQQLGHEPVFVLELIQIPVEGQFWRRLDTGTVLVSEELLRSRNLLAPLESVIRDLVGLR